MIDEEVLQIILHLKCNRVKTLDDGMWPCLINPFIDKESGSPNWTHCIKFFNDCKALTIGMTRKEKSKWNKGYHSVIIYFNLIILYMKSFSRQSYIRYKKIRVERIN